MRRDRRRCTTGATRVLSSGRWGASSPAARRMRAACGKTLIDRAGVAVVTVTVDHALATDGRVRAGAGQPRVQTNVLGACVQVVAVGIDVAASVRARMAARTAQAPIGRTGESV